MNNRGSLFFATILFSAISYQASAQDLTDALRYSYLSPMGTARSIGFGNALGSIGGDFATLSVNPAGIGIYRTSEIMFTPSLKANSVDGTYMGNTESSNNTRFNFNNIGVVFSNALRGRRYERSKWKAVSFGVGLNRLADFNRDYSYSGQNSGPNSSSYSELFAINADEYPNQALNMDPSTPGGMATSAGLITYDTGIGAYRTLVPWNAGITQSRTVSERGGINEVVLSFGGNYMEKLMLGATLGIPIINYTRDAQVLEAANTPTADFSSYTYSESLSTKGTGVNLKIGAIYKPTDEFRIGFAIHTPTYYSMHDIYTTTLNNSGAGVVPSNTSTYDYNLVTPWRAVISAAGFLGKHGFITADYEYVDYPSAQFVFDASNKDLQRSVNNDISTAYKAGSIFRIGAEGRITNTFFVRAGFGYYSSPYKDYTSDTRMDFSGGVGFRFDHWYIDLAYLHTQFNNPEDFYVLNYANTAPIIQSATLKNSLNTAVMTLGFKF